MNLVLAKTETGRALGDIFTASQGHLPGKGKVAEVRRQAFEAYERIGLPHRRIEDWKYTDLRMLMREVLPLASTPDAAAIERARSALKSHAVEGASKLVLVDGVFVSALSDVAGLEAGVSVRSLRDILDDNGNDIRADLLVTKQTDPMVSLNAALATDGVVLGIADGALLSRPVQIIHVATTPSASAFTRSHVKVGHNVRATLVESFIAAEGAKAHQANDAVIVSIGDGSELSHVRLMADETDAINVTSQIFTVGAKARLNLFNMTSGAAVSRFQGFITLAGEGTELSINGVNLLRGKQHGDMTLVVDHAVPNCTSREVFRAVVDDRAHSVFQGRINVWPKAQKTDAKMMTRALLLSDEAEADNKPELEIFADDVTCGHGATTGALDDSLLFYLRARGLSEKEAQALLIQAFVGEAIEQIADDGLRELVIANAQRWLEMRQ
ncbi:MAG TPA: Fe-S cluster assembly protein SufD [Bradyrhizobium sp.]|nr:Fe-S cluster assembly protein SufD [Bradyrhizobium sp.]